MNSREWKGSHRLRELVSHHLGVERGQVVPEAYLLEDLGADSMDLLDLVLVFEEAFDIALPDEIIASMRTVGEIEEYVAGCGAGKTP